MTASLASDHRSTAVSADIDLGEFAAVAYKRPLIIRPMFNRHNCDLVNLDLEQAPNLSNKHRS